MEDEPSDKPAAGGGDAPAGGIAAISGATKKHRAPNRLIVDEAATDDNSMLILSQDKVSQCSTRLPRNRDSILGDVALPHLASITAAKPNARRCYTHDSRNMNFLFAPELRGFSTLKPSLGSCTTQLASCRYEVQFSFVAVLSQMDELDIYKGDLVRIKGKRQRETACIAVSEEGVEPGTV